MGVLATPRIFLLSVYVCVGVRTRVPTKPRAAPPAVARIESGKPCAWRPLPYITTKATSEISTGAYAPDWELPRLLPLWPTNWPELFGLSLPANCPLISASLLTMKKSTNSADSNTWLLALATWAINSPLLPHEKVDCPAQKTPRYFHHVPCEGGSVFADEAGVKTSG